MNCLPSRKIHFCDKEGTVKVTSLNSFNEVGGGGGHLWHLPVFIGSLKNKTLEQWACLENECNV